MEYIHFVESKNSAGLLVISALTDAVTSQIDILCDTIKKGKLGCHSRLGPNRNCLAFPASFQSYYHIGKLVIEGMLLAETVPASCEEDDAVLMRYIHMSVESGYPVYIAGDGTDYLVIDENCITCGVAVCDNEGVPVLKETPLMAHDGNDFDLALSMLISRFEHPQICATRARLKAVLSNNVLSNSNQQGEETAPDAVLTVIEKIHGIILERSSPMYSMVDDLHHYLTVFCDLWDDARIHQILTTAVNDGLADPVYLEPCITNGFKRQDILDIVEITSSEQLDMENYHYVIQTIRTLCVSYGTRGEDVFSECCLRRNRNEYYQLLNMFPDAKNHIARKLAEMTVIKYRNRSSHASPDWKNEFYHLTAIRRELESQSGQKGAIYGNNG